MTKEQQKQIREKLDIKIEMFGKSDETSIPTIGWIKAIRISIGMTLKQLAIKMNVSMQNVNQLEQREKDGAITINKLKETASALNMKLVYGFIPNEGTLQKLYEKRAEQLASESEMKTSNSDEFEDDEKQDESFFNLLQRKK